MLVGLTNRVESLLGARLRERSVWQATKAVYSSLIAQSIRWEIGESFFNSLTRRVFATEGVDQAIEFVDTDFEAPPTEHDAELCRASSGAALPDLISSALTDVDSGFAKDHWRDLDRAIAAAAERILSRIVQQKDATLEIFRGVFYRGRGAYLVGRITAGAKAIPVAFSVRHPDESGLTLDAVLMGEGDLAILFSYTRAYFRVAAPSPYDLVKWLRELMPLKRTADLYNTTPNEVMRRYKLVFEHDRAGRLVEAHEFEHLRITRNRFEPALLEDLLRAAGKTVRPEGDDVVIAHAYVERRIRPLNIFFAEADATQIAAAARDYGQAIKDLAVSNIFPGDVLTKNFGVTRRGRVVFYDYDELCFLTDCNFRDLPQASTYEEEISAEPWFSVRENDVFPEEFPNFLSLPGPARAALLEQHADLFHPDFWRSVQRKLREGETPEVFPYRPERRLVTAN